MHIYKSLAIFFILLLSIHLKAQQGIIRGIVYDEEIGEFLPGVTIFAEGTTTGTLTDLDGKFNLAIEPGTYNIKVSFISYETFVIKDVKVKDGEVTLLDDIWLKETSFELTEVVVTAQQVRNTEAALLTIKQKSVNVIDGISSTSIRKTGDSDAAASIKRVPGISVEGGKYVYVRGLGDRYTKTTLNGAEIPGLDPDRNALQIDIFPTNIIDNIIVYKSFTPNLPADFTGGIIDIALKDFPEEKKANITLSSEYNPNFHFNNSFLTYNGGKTDWLGFDDGTRNIPATENIPFFSEVVGDPNGTKGMRYQEILNNFNATMAAHEKMSTMDFSAGTSFGNQFVLKKITLGYEAALSYKNTTEFFKDAQFGRYGLSGNPNIYEMEVRELQTGDYGVNNVLWNVLAGFAVKTLKAKYRLTALHLQNGESLAGIFDYLNSDQGAVFEGFQHNLGYSQRQLTNILLAGKHFFGDSKWNVDWKISPTLSKLYEPDIRFTRYIYRENSIAIGTESGFPERIWRNLEEINLSSVLNVTKEFKINNQKAELQFGGAYTFKERDFIIHNFALNIRNVPLTGNPDELFLPENLWPMNGNSGQGTTFEAPFIPTNPNQFNSSINITAAYASIDLFIFKKLKTIVGLRLENFTQRYTGQDQLGNNKLDNDIVLDELGFFPSINFIYKLNEMQNLRFSYTKTIARPSFKELSYAEIYDPISGRTFIGGLFRDANDVAGIEYWDGNLISTDIHNIDLRWEMFQEKGQTISVSAFYKRFNNPIEIVQYATQTGSFQPRNVGDGDIFGSELELRQSIGLLSSSLRNLNLVANFSYIYSRIEMSKTEYNSRVLNARTGQTIGKYRDMAGQAPYLLNAGLSFSGADKGFWNNFEAGLFFNVQGQTLTYVGIADRPDIYTKPFNSLNFNALKNFGKDNQYQLGFRISNILNQKKQAVFTSYNADDQFFEVISPGIAFKLSFTYSIF